MLLKDFYDYKNQLMKDILTNKEIVKLIDPNLDFSNAKSLAYKKVLPYEYIPESVETGGTYVCFDVDIHSSSSKTFLEPTLYIWTFSYRSVLRLPEGGIRPDAIVSEIYQAIGGSRVYGLGNLNLYSVKRFAPMEDYIGKVMTFYMTEVNKVAPNYHPIPSNRKNG